MKEETKDLKYWKLNAEEDYIKTPISVLRYISELEKSKEMEKERIIKTYEVGISRGTNYDEDVYHKNNWRSGEQYYNETFK